VSEDKGDALLDAEIGEPVPGEDALDADDDILAKGLDGIEEVSGLGEVVVRDQERRQKRNN